MKALVYHGPGERGWDSVGDPTILDPTDILVRIDTTTICGTDLHILKGDVPATFELATELIRPGGRARGQHRGARQAGHAASREALDSSRPDLDVRTGRTRSSPQ